jgi:ATP-dependent Lon protease
MASVLQLLKLPDGTVKVLVEGRARASIVELHRPRRLLRSRASNSCRARGGPVEIEALARSVSPSSKTM